jgi:hypothetical protein
MVDLSLEVAAAAGDGSGNSGEDCVRLLLPPSCLILTPHILP